MRLKGKVALVTGAASGIGHAKISSIWDSAAVSGAHAYHAAKGAGRPMEVAYGCLFLACDESSYIRGTESAIDGGYLAQ